MTNTDAPRYTVGSRGPTHLSHHTTVILTPHGPDAMPCGPEIEIPAHEAARLIADNERLRTTLKALVDSVTTEWWPDIDKHAEAAHALLEELEATQ